MHTYLSLRYTQDPSFVLGKFDQGVKDVSHMTLSGFYGERH